jgi:hypothetical protein
MFSPFTSFYIQTLKVHKNCELCFSFVYDSRYCWNFFKIYKLSLKLSSPLTILQIQFDLGPNGDHFVELSNTSMAIFIVDFCSKILTQFFFYRYTFFHNEKKTKYQWNTYCIYIYFVALHAAALSGHARSVKLLLDHGAHIDAADFMKHTPLFRACEMGHTDVVQTLIDDGARVDMLDDDGRSPLHWYVYTNYLRLLLICTNAS